MYNNESWDLLKNEYKNKLLNKQFLQSSIANQIQNTSINCLVRFMLNDGENRNRFNFCMNWYFTIKFRQISDIKIYSAIYQWIQCWNADISFSQLAYYENCI